VKACVISLLAVACHAPDPCEPSAAPQLPALPALVGTLSELDSGVPAAGATIIVGEEVAISDDDGRYAVGPISRGPHEVNIYYGDTSLTATVELRAGSITRYDARIRPNRQERFPHLACPAATAQCVDTDAVVARALVDARKHPTLLQDWYRLPGDSAIRVLDHRDGATHSVTLPPGFARFDPVALQRAADADRQVREYVAIDNAVIAGDCATVRLVVEPIVPSGITLNDGRIRTTLQYMRSDRGWRLVAHAMF
jgi:hypothetical protein